jgi:hypothetical protein
MRWNDGQIETELTYRNAVGKRGQIAIGQQLKKK